MTENEEPSKLDEALNERCAMCKSCQRKDTCQTAFVIFQPCPDAAEEEELGRFIISQGI